jgi:hypothetical protein
MADDSKNATTRGRSILGTRQTVTEMRLVVENATLEVTAAASAASTYVMHRIPSSSRIYGMSKVYFDDLASTGSPTIDFGIKAVVANVTTDVDALNDGVDVFTAASSAPWIKDIANYGKQAWEFSSATADPGGMIDLTITILDAGTNTGGTITSELVFSTDAG